MAKIERSKTLDGTCGVGLFWGFQTYDNYYGRPLTKNAPPVGGCGWNIAGFINDNDRKSVYEEMKATYKIVQQSPVRRNRNSGNNFFYVMYDCKKPRRSKNNPEAKYDLSGNEKFSWPWK